MKFKRKLFLFILSIAASVAGCRDTKTIADNNVEIAGRNWSYTEKVQMPVVIQDETIPYNVYVNLRHTSNYKYSNIFVLIHITGPDKKKTTERREFKLALPDGEWLGSGSGNMYSYQLPYKANYKFPLKGKYIIEIEQNMRDNPLDYVTDAGIRVEKAN